jgi:integrase
MNTMLKLCYEMGLRVSKMVNLNTQDSDSKNIQVSMARAKGKKDRYANPPETILAQLRADCNRRPGWGPVYHPKGAERVFRSGVAAKLRLTVVDWGEVRIFGSYLQA